MKRRNIDEIPYIEFKYRVFRVTSMCDRSRILHDRYPES